jgi:membrane associated rhomboid family serine protease
MGLRDRQYMRDAYNPPVVTKWLIWTLIGAFVVQSVAWFYWDFNASDHLGLTLNGLRHGKVWQLFTFQFLHSCPFPLHVLFNCLGLWFFGRPVEEVLGSRRFLKVYFGSGLAGGALQALLTWALPRHLDNAVVGASAGVCGLVAVFCSLYPMQELTTWIYFFPIQVRAYFLLLFLGGLSLFGALIPFDGIAHGAHLGGILVGVGYVRFRGQFADLAERLIPSKRFQGVRLRSEPGQPKSILTRAKTKLLPTGNQETFISREIDPILDKISAHGFESLTEEERKTLESARKKIRS